MKNNPFISVDKVFLIILLSFIVCACVYSGFQFYKIGNIKKDWNEYIFVTDTKIELISELKKTIGYGGMIHNYKNYLLRSDEAYYSRTKTDMFDAYSIIRRIKNIDPISPKEIELLSIISNTIKKYETALETVKSKTYPDIISKDIDGRVQDKNTLNAFKSFEEIQQLNKVANINKLNKDVSSAQRTLFVALGLSSVFIFFVLFLGKRKLQLAQSQLDKERQEKIHLSRLSAVGQMAGSIAHEINNPMAIISGRASMLKNLVSADKLDKKSVIESTEAINKTVDRVSAVIASLRDLTASNENILKENFHLSSLLDETLILCRDKYALEDISIYINCNPDLVIYAKKVQLSQVILNILNNSFDALKDLNEKWIKIDAYKSEKNMIIRIQDSGQILSKEIRSRLMVPFFTTKPTREGTGIGLSISKSIMKKHGGNIYLSDNPKNTEFVIEIPA